MQIKSIFILVGALILSGCAHEQYQYTQVPPANLCNKRAEIQQVQIKQQIVDGCIVAVEYADDALEMLKSAEAYLTKKIEEWKIEHPEFVAKATEKLEEIRLQIQTYIASQGTIQHD